MRKWVIVVCLGVLILVPIVVLAADLNSYRIDSGGETYYVHYSGFVPCGKDVWVSDNPDGLGGQSVHLPCQFCHLFVMLAAIISFLLTTLVPLLAVGMLIIAGIMYYLALGNPGKVAKANKLLVGIFLGLFLVYGAWLIIGALFSVIGVAEWTGLRGGWYQVNCPLRYVAFEPTEGDFLALCGEGTGPKLVGGMRVLCIDGGTMIMSQTVGSAIAFTNRDRALKACSDLSLPSNLSGKWTLPSVGDWRYAWSRAKDYLHCEMKCDAWDNNNCCTGRNSTYWTSGKGRPMFGAWWENPIFFFTKDGRAGRTVVSNSNWFYADVRCVYIEMGV